MSEAREYYPIMPDAPEEMVERSIRQRISEREAMPNRRQAYSEDAVQSYLNQAGRHKLLTKEQEFELAEKIEQGVQARQQLESDTKIGDADVLRLKRLARAGDRAKELFINSNLRLVISIAKRYQGGGMPMDDLIQEGNLGLIRAVEKFDRHTGFKFSTYATFWIRQAIGRGIANKSRNVRLPKYVLDQITSLENIRITLVDELGREPTDTEIAEFVGVEPEKIPQLQIFGQAELSINQKTGDDEKSSEFGDYLVDTRAQSVESEVIEQLNRIETQHLFDTAGLTSRERLVMELRFGLDGCEPKTVEAIGQQFEVTRERVRQIQKLAIDKLRLEAKTQDNRPDLEEETETTLPKPNLHTKNSKPRTRNGSSVITKPPEQTYMSPKPKEKKIDITEDTLKNFRDLGYSDAEICNMLEITPQELDARRLLYDQSK